MVFAPDSIAGVTSRTGVTPQPGLGQAYPEFRDLSERILQRIAALPWIAPGWITEVRAYQSARPDLDGGRPIMVPRRITSTKTGVRLPDSPAWVVGGERVELWDRLADETRQAMVELGQRRLDEGRRIMEAADRNAAFWDRLARAAEFVRDIPAAVGKAAGDVASGFSVALLKAAWPALLIAGAAALAWIGWMVLRRKANQ